ncbi:hypothetical protein N7463_009764 [Penicillium fimorum]|uniref:AMP-dependent synthetase/ligase domain-containing protein n=1 Tax=Penicillium fimorum TaxID=1882269 RepID=A0A9W9XIM2_9EURO|nr:hypothetical protein N7463_009764 [Penicillium fimorum]
MSHVLSFPEVIPLGTKASFDDTISVIEEFDPTGPSHVLPQLSPEDAGTIREWNKTIPAKINQCVHDLIHSRSLSQPEAVAVCAGNGQLTYRELDVMSSALAARLATYDMGPNQIVPLIFEKSMWTAIALLGVMKAGGAFLLVDIAHPIARLKEILNITAAKLVIASETQAELARQLDLEVVYVGVNLNTPNKTESCPPSCLPVCFSRF